MSKDVSNFKGFRKGDIATLSDIQTQKEFGDLTTDFKIIEVRTYREPNDFFHYTGYICEYQGKKEDDEPQQIMILLREMEDMYDLFVYYMDQDGDVTDYAEHLIEEKEIEDENSEEDSADLDEDNLYDNEEDENESITEDLKERWEVTLHFDEGDTDVTWDKKGAGSTFGVETTSTETGDDVKTLAEYFTNDETHGNPHCFIEWTGDSKKGWIEIWYGCEIKPEDIEMFRTKK